ncbi:MAG: DNA polymerase Y family protein [Hyphomicrobiaceae bacterium]|nr:DNA polymerase Y family protein [Hyphomicrobiaceae bacterium]
MRRVLSLWFPHLAIDRVTRRDVSLRDIPFAFISESANRVALHAVNGHARASGVAERMSLSDARAVCPQLAIRPAEPRADARLLRSLARWMEHYSPSIAFDKPDGLFADMSGVSHLFGGETEMIAGLTGKLERFGICVRAALADTAGAAWALARHGCGCTIVSPGAQRAALSPLPIAALRVGNDVAQLGRRLGLKKISDLYPLPRSSIASRFGLETLKRFDQALGRDDEPLRHIRFVPALKETLVFAEPIGRTEDVEAALRLVLERLCARLEQKEKGARLTAFNIEQVDGTRQTLTIATTQPSRSPAALLHLFRDQFDKLDAGFGIERVHVSAERCELLTTAQLNTPGKGTRPADETDTGLIDRLVNRFGYDHVLRLVPAESHLPERAWLAFSAADTSHHAPWSAPVAARPLRLLSPPEPVAAETHAGGGTPPAAIRFRGKLLALIPLGGPERIEPEWWHDDPAWRSGTREYWWVRDGDGHHLWLFRVGEPHAHGAWFLHGFGG